MIGVGVSITNMCGGAPKWWKPTATLAYEFSNDRYMQDGVSIPQSTAIDCTAGTDDRYAVNSAGIYVPFAADLPRVAGRLLIEPSATNTYPYPQEEPHTNSVTTPRANLNNATGPDGTLTAWRFSSGATGTGQANENISADMSSHSWMTLVKKTRAGAKFKPSVTGINGVDNFGAAAAYDFDTDTFVSMPQATSTVYPNGWVLLEATFVNNGSGTTWVNRIDPQAGNEDGFICWCWNHTNSNTASFPILTGGGIRAADKPQRVWRSICALPKTTIASLWA